MPFRPVVLALAVLLSAGGGRAVAQDARRISGTVTDGASGVPIPAAAVELAGTSWRAVTGSAGRFELTGIPAGSYLMRITHAAYGTHTDSIQVRTQDLALVVRVLPHAIRLDPLTAEAAAERPVTSRSYAITREQIEAVISSARHLGDVVRAYIPGAMVYETAAGYVCLELRGARGARMTRGCNFPLVIVDHTPVQAPGQFLRDTPPEEIERIEFVPASAGAARYGIDSQYGALVIRTRRSGVVTPPPDSARAADIRQPSYPAYRWSAEPGRHPWQRTIVASTLGNGAGVAIGLAALGCFGGDSGDGTGDCIARGDGMAEAAALALPMIGSAAAARIFGATPHSRGTGFHSAAAAAIPLILGFAMYRDGESADFGASRLIGSTLVLVGAPVAATIADGLFRRSREPPAAR